jgi:hypothetical protein
MSLGLGSWHLKCKSQIISMVGFRNFFCAWSGLFILELKSLMRGEVCTFYPAMTSLSRYLEETAFSISIFSSVFVLLLLFSRCIMDMASSFVFISCPFLRTCSGNLDLPSAYWEEIHEFFSISLTWNFYICLYYWKQCGFVSHFLSCN